MTRLCPTARRRGAVAPFIAVCSFAVLGVMALALDGGLLMYERQRTRTAADSAALAAAENLYLHYPTNSGLDPSGTAQSAALAVAAAGGYSNDGVNSTVTVNIPPKSGQFTGTAGYAEVVIQLNQPRLYSAIWGSGRIPVTARAVARGLWSSFTNGIVLLDPTMSGALSMSGGGTLNVNNATVTIDSNNSQAGYSGGGSVATAKEFDIVGGYGASSGGAFNGTIVTNSQPVPDPLAYLPEPDPSTLTVQSTKKLSISGGLVTLYPGVYDGGIQISGNASVFLTPGIYYMNTGGFSFSGGGSTGGALVGAGVMIYNAPGSNGNSNTISINGNSSSIVNLSPPTSGIYAGISVFQDRTSTAQVSVAGNGSFSITGTFYAAKANLAVAGNGASSTIGSQYVSDSLNVTGGGTVNITWSQNTTARKRLIGLVE